jgi:hypothetical protein
MHWILVAAMYSAPCAEPIHVYNYAEAPCRQVSTCEEPGLPELAKLLTPDVEYKEWCTGVYAVPSYHPAISRCPSTVTLPDPADVFASRGITPDAYRFWSCRRFGEQLYRCLPPAPSFAFLSLEKFLAHKEARKRETTICKPPGTDDVCRAQESWTTTLRQ